MMRLEYINAFIDVQRAADRLAKRIDGISYDTDLHFRTVNEFMEAARLTDSSIKRELYSDGRTYTLKFWYRGVEFWYMGNDAGEAEVA